MAKGAFSISATRKPEQSEPTPERMAKAEAWEMGDVGRITLLSPLAALHKKGAIHGISNKQYCVGVKFKKYWEGARMAGGLQSPDPNRIFATDCNFDHTAKTDWGEQCRDRLAQARSLVGPITYKALEMVVGAEMTLVDAGGALSWGNASQARAAAQERIRCALEALCTIW